QPEDSAVAVAAARAAGLDVNLDLIFGWPGQTLADWVRDLETALALAPDHVSCYPLELRLDPEEAVANWPGGGWPVLERWRRRAAAAQADDAGIALLYRVAERILGRHGYRHYEIANWPPPRVSARRWGRRKRRAWCGAPASTRGSRRAGGSWRARSSSGFWPSGTRSRRNSRRSARSRAGYRASGAADGARAGDQRPWTRARSRPAERRTDRARAATPAGPAGS